MILSYLRRIHHLTQPLPVLHSRRPQYAAADRRSLPPENAYEGSKIRDEFELIFSAAISLFKYDHKKLNNSLIGTWLTRDVVK